MKLTLGFMTIDYIGKDDTAKRLSYNGQVCLDGIETFIAKREEDGTFKTFCYGKREFAFEQIMEKYGDDLKPVIDKLAIDKSSDLKAAKKNLTKLRKEAKGYKVK
jgi:hypothetical protein